MIGPRSRRSFTALCALSLAGALTVRSQEAAARVPASVNQLVVAVADSWSSQKGRLMVFERSGANAPWTPVLPKAIPVLFGKSGLAWGNGLLPVPHGQGGVPSKREKDRRAPAGLFRIGMLFGYGAKAPPGVRNPYYQVTARDCWVDDVNHPAYNRHIVVDPKSPPAWYDKQRMRLGDFAYEWLLEIRHNSDPPVPGHGSAIFFHIRRGVSTPTSGCTTMARSDLLKLIQRLDPKLKPHYLLLPAAEYNARIKSWGLPPQMP
ncbi:MAG TPA: L,D-transpeptidase family protein [Verrucomicrobiales bacterium]|nr:L,D-transpeptidase family protein [Verrucomicrobiales bacterium]